MSKFPVIESEQPSTGTGPSSKKRGMLAKVFLVDSVERNFARTKNYLSTYGKNSKAMATWMAKSFNSEPVPAENIEQIKATVVRTAGGMVAAFFVTIFFAFICLWQYFNGNEVASTIVALVTLTYAFRFFAIMVVWFKAKTALIKAGAW